MAETVNDYMETDLGNVAPNPKGEYNGETEYEYLDLVTYSGGSYLCVKEDGTISGIAPESGKNTEYWQNVAIPGDITPEYVALHDDVLNKAESVSADAQAVAGDREQVESIKEDVTALQQQTRENAESAKSDKESAAGYARAAEQSRNYAAEAEENIRALTSGFDTHVEEKKQDAQDEIEKSRKAAVQVIASQQVLSQNAVSQEGKKAIEQTQSDAAATAADREAVSEMAATVSQQAEQVATNTAQVSEDKTTAENAMQSAQESKKQAVDAAESVTEAVEQIAKNKNDIESMKATKVDGAGFSLQLNEKGGIRITYREE